MVHRPGAGELTVEITVPSPSGGEQVVEMTAMAAVDLAEALTAPGACNRALSFAQIRVNLGRAPGVY